MKTRLITLITLVLLSTLAFSQEEFNGVITYKITYSGENINEQIISILPDQMTLKVKGQKTKTILLTPMGDQVSITNLKKNSVVNLLDMMGRKFAIQLTDKELENEISRYADLNAIPMNETKELHGIECTRIDISVNHANFDGPARFTTYSTEKFENLKGINFADPVFHDIPGLLMEFETIARGIGMHFQVISMEETKLNDSEFKIPKDYEITTKEEMKKSLGGR